VTPLLGALPEGSAVVMRQTHSGVVETVWGGDYGRRLLDARVGGVTCYYDSSLIVERDRPLLAKGARFWLVVEEIRTSGGRAEWRSAIALRRDGIEGAEQAFTARRDAAR
jgi:hypothetical protein